VTGPEWRWKVREYEEPDRPAIEACFRQLQEFERTIDSDRAQAETVVEPYIDWILEHCRERAGKIYVADDGGRVVAFLCVWLDSSLSGMISVIKDVAYISDLVVSKHYRRRGIAKALLSQAEAYATSRGVPYIVVGVLAGNRAALEAYHQAGFNEYDLRLVKRVNSPALGQ
jgi:ribosomal protein S18 acetylase RimI-like enzyme